jgi:hypothetical protein
LRSRLDEVSGDLLDIAADIADLGELGCLDFQKRRLGETGEAARDSSCRTRLARSSGCSSAAPPRAARPAALAAPAVSGAIATALRLVLTDDKPVELGNDLARAEQVAGGSDGVFFIQAGSFQR